MILLGKFGQNLGKKAAKTKKGSRKFRNPLILFGWGKGI